MVGRWLLKTEPEEWSWDHQQANRGISHWDGVRNAQAQKHLRAMELGDLCFFYHSGAKAKEIVGIARVCKPFYLDPSDASGKLGMVDIEAVSKLSQPLALSSLKQEDGLHSFIMFRQPRLSVVPISTAEWNLICQLGGQLEPPLLLEVNGEFRVVVNDPVQAPLHNADVRVRVNDQIAQYDDETRVAPPDMPSRSSPKVRRQPRKHKTLTDATKVKASESIPPLEVPQVARNNSLRTESEEVSSADATEDDVTCTPSDSIVMKAIKFVPDSKRVYSRRSRKQGEVEALPINAKVNDSRGMASADAGRVYKRRNR